LVYGHHHGRSNPVPLQDRHLMDVLRGEKADMAASNRHRDVVGDLRHNLVGSCGLGQEDNAARTPHCVRTNC
jgi:hypothetical protein